MQRPMAGKILLVTGSIIDWDQNVPGGCAR